MKFFTLKEDFFLVVCQETVLKAKDGIRNRCECVMNHTQKLSPFSPKMEKGRTLPTTQNDIKTDHSRLLSSRSYGSSAARCWS